LMKRRLFIRMWILCFVSNLGLGQTQDTLVQRYTITEDSIQQFEMPQILVIGTSESVIKKLPGTFGRINTLHLRKTDPLTSNEILRRVPGLNIVDEEGAGMRLNIGVRGLDPDRSRNILVLEDGIPIALNPYGEPELYFSPSIDRMSGVEVLKGSGQVLFGPQTIGGVVNFTTQDPPEKATTLLRIRGGQEGYFSGFASYGNSFGKAGFLVSVLHKRADNMGYTGFNITDINAKFKFALTSRSKLGWKIGYYDEVSNATYIGLTQTMFDAGGQDYTRMAPDDLLPVKRYSSSLTHEFRMNSNVLLHTTAFAYRVTRDWRRQDFSTNPNALNQSGVVWGDPNIPGGAIFMLSSNSHRNRQFEVKGIESKAVVNGNFLNQPNQLTIGGRLLWETAYEQFVLGAKPNATTGIVRDDEIRSGQAISLFAQNQWEVSSKWTINAGVRLEHYNFERAIFRGRYSVNGAMQIRDTNIVSTDRVVALIPGGGISFEATEFTTFFGGIHRGFAPPRVKDALDNLGISLQLDPELSTNYELGLRTQLKTGFQSNLTFFRMDFENQIIPVSISSGQLNATGLANGGETNHTGVEWGIELDISEILALKRHQFQFDLSATYARSIYAADRWVGSEQINVKGNRLPYAPEWTIWAGIYADLDFGFGFHLNASFVDAQFTDELNSILPNPNGRTGLIESRMVLDAGICYKTKKYPLTLRLNAKNLTNARYIASRRPQGIRLGLPRFITGGVDISF